MTKRLKIDLTKHRIAPLARLVTLVVLIVVSQAAGRITTEAAGLLRESTQADTRASAITTARVALDQARRLVLGLHPSELVLIDPEMAADPAAVRRLDAFTVREEDGRMRRKVYINMESAVVSQAAAGDRFYVGVLAAVIVHELAHLDGADEAAARRAERTFIEELLARGRLDRSKGQQYLAFLRSQWKASP